MFFRIARIRFKLVLVRCHGVEFVDSNGVLGTRVAAGSVCHCSVSTDTGVSADAELVVEVYASALALDPELGAAVEVNFAEGKEEVELLVVFVKGNYAGYRAAADLDRSVGEDFAVAFKLEVDVLGKGDGTSVNVNFR